jgi:fructosamine-3-kinase
MFQAEAQGLSLLNTAQVLKIPEVIAVGETQDSRPSFLMLEWLESGPASPASFRALGEGLAILHQIHGPSYGLEDDNYIGSLPQINQPGPTWREFYAECRLRPQLEIARRTGKLSDRLGQALSQLIVRLAEWIPDTPSAPSLLHGDLWRGNVMTLVTGEPALIDPAVYYGQREVEMAFAELFGGFGPEFFSAYNAVYPLDKDYPVRRLLYQLYPLMVHMNLFGGGYTRQVEEVVRHYIG